MKDAKGQGSLTTKLVIATAIALLAAGCATVNGPRERGATDTAARAHALSRAERVFLYQSRVADALLDHYPLVEMFEDADPVLREAEAQMTRTCSPLTRAVLAHVEGGKPSLGLRFRVMTSIGACERAARRIDQLLNATADAASI